MPISLNAFGQTVAKGMCDLRNGGGNPVSCQIDVTSALGVDGGVGLVPGQAVKLVTTALGGVPKVVEATTDADDIFGFIVYDVKSTKFMRGDRCEVLAMRNGVMYMEANAAIARGAEIAVLIAGQKVITATATDRIVGRAFDGCSAAGKFIRVSLDLPGLIKA